MSSVVDLAELSEKLPVRFNSCRAAHPVDAGGQGIAYVIRDGIWRRGMCTCKTWSGRRRLLKASAVQDAQLHAIRSGCDLAFPLVPPPGMTWVPTC